MLSLPSSSTHFSLAGLVSPVHTSAPIQTTTTGSQAWVCMWNVVIAWVGVTSLTRQYISPWLQALTRHTRIYAPNGSSQSLWCLSHWILLRTCRLFCDWFPAPCCSSDSGDHQRAPISMLRECYFQSVCQRQHRYPVSADKDRGHG